MAKSKLDPGTGGDSGSPTWLLSYADMMTLIACFFILLMAFANYDPVGFTKKTLEVSKHFNKDKFKSADNPLQELREEIARHPELKKMVKTSVVDSTLNVTFSGSALFPPGAYELTEELRFKLDTLIDLIKLKSPNFRIVVEGHTDNRKIDKKSTPFSSNWGLSAARAASVIHRFEYFGFDPQYLAALGLADTKPLIPNEDERGNPISENQRLNRRVVIKVLESNKGGKNFKLGFGAYFDADNKGL